MILQEAKLFVAKFAKGEYSPAEYAEFLDWLEKASLDEMDIVTTQYEEQFDLMDIPALSPSQQWIDQLEAKLDRVDESLALYPYEPRGIGGRTRRLVAVFMAILAAIGSLALFCLRIGKNKIT